VTLEKVRPPPSPGVSQNEEPMAQGCVSTARRESENKWDFDFRR